MLEVLIPETSSPLFPRLEDVIVLGQESGLEDMARKRSDCGMPLKTFAVGEGPGSCGYGNLKDYKVSRMICAWGSGGGILSLSLVPRRLEGHL